MAQIYIVQRGSGNRCCGGSDASGIQRGKYSRQRTGAIVHPCPQAAGIQDDLAEQIVEPAQRGANIGFGEGVGQLHLNSVAPQLGLQPFGRPLDDELPMIDGGNVLRQMVGLLKIMRGEHDGQPILARQPGNLAPQVWRCSPSKAASMVEA